MKEDAPVSHQQRAARRRLCSVPLADGSMRLWRMRQLWEAAAGLPARKVRVADLPGFDRVRWFGGPLHLLPTCRAVVEHARDICEADLSFPIILCPSGDVLDGMHRICKSVAPRVRRDRRRAVGGAAAASPPPAAEWRGGERFGP